MTVRRNPTAPSTGPGAEMPCDAIVQPTRAPEPPPGSTKETKANPADVTPSGASGAAGDEVQGRRD